MGVISYAIPEPGAANATEDPKVANALTLIAALLNGNLDAANVAASLAAVMFAPGDLKASAAAATPTGWLLCDGAAVSRTGATAALFAAIGTAYGTGDGSTTFNVPDYRGRVVVGVDTTSGGPTRNRGDVGGEATHTLSVGEVPALSVTAVQPSHEITDAFNAYTGQPGTNFAVDIWSSQSLATSGGGGAHNNMQPFRVANIFIKT